MLPMQINLRASNKLDSNRYQSIAPMIIYNFTFDSKVTGWIVWLQIHENGTGASAILRYRRHFKEFVGKWFVLSTWTDKTFYWAH